MNKDFRSRAYRAWAIGGIVALFVTPIALSLAGVGYRALMFTFIALLGVYFAGIIAFTLRAVTADAPIDRAATPARSAPPRAADPPVDRIALRRALVVGPVDVDAERRAAAASSRGLRSFVLYEAALLAAFLIGAALSFAGIGTSLHPLGSTGPRIPLVLLPAFALLAYGVIRIPFALWRARSSGDADLKPLGLALGDAPSIVVGARVGGRIGVAMPDAVAVFAGERHGRAVEIQLGIDRYETFVAGRVAPFSVRAEDETLRASGGSPAAVEAAVEDLSPNERWRGVVAEGGEDGVLVGRSVDAATHADERWLDDLWLAERLADSAAGDAEGRAAHTKP
jgi:hypothetical protein